MGARPVDISGITGALGQLGQSNALVAQRRDQARRERDARRQETAGLVLGTVGGVAGALAGGPAGAASGFGVGNALGRGAAGGRVDTAQVVQGGLGVAGAIQNQAALEQQQAAQQEFQSALNPPQPIQQTGAELDPSIPAQTPIDRRRVIGALAGFPGQQGTAAQLALREGAGAAIRQPTAGNLRTINVEGGTQQQEFKPGEGFVNVGPVITAPISTVEVPTAKDANGRLRFKSGPNKGELVFPGIEIAADEPTTAKDVNKRLRFTSGPNKGGLVFSGVTPTPEAPSTKGAFSATVIGKDGTPEVQRLNAAGELIRVVGKAPPIQGANNFQIPGVGVRFSTDNKTYTADDGTKRNLPPGSFVIGREKASEAARAALQSREATGALAGGPGVAAPPPVVTPQVAPPPTGGARVIPVATGSAAAKQEVRKVRTAFNTIKEGTGIASNLKAFANKLGSGIQAVTGQPVVPFPETPGARTFLALTRRTGQELFIQNQRWPKFEVKELDKLLQGLNPEEFLTSPAEQTERVKELHSFMSRRFQANSERIANPATSQVVRDDLQEFNADITNFLQLMGAPPTTIPIGLQIPGSSPQQKAPEEMTNEELDEAIRVLQAPTQQGA